MHLKINTKINNTDFVEMTEEYLSFLVEYRHKLKPSNNKLISDEYNRVDNLIKTLETLLMIENVSNDFKNNNLEWISLTD